MKGWDLLVFILLILLAEKRSLTLDLKEIKQHQLEQRMEDNEEEKRAEEIYELKLREEKIKVKEHSKANSSDPLPSRF